MSRRWRETLILSLVLVCATAAAAERTTARSNCRRDPGSIVGGVPAAIRNWPGYAALRARDDSGNLHYFCGGTLIAPSVVLTAAHCVQRLARNPEGEWVLPRRGVVEVLFDSDDLRAPRPGAVRQVADRIVHERWTGVYEQGHDLALLRLRTAYRGELARLSNSPVSDGATRAYSAGFGLLADRTTGGETVHWSGPGGTVTAGSPDLREVMVPTVSHAACQAAYPALQPNQLCAGYEEGGKDTCSGDSGGPLNAVDEMGCPYQIGIVSYGKGCAGRQAYGVYTRLPPFLPWIAQHVPEFAPGRPIVPQSAGVASHEALDSLLATLPPHSDAVTIRMLPSTRLRLGETLSIVVRSRVRGRLLLLDENASGEIVQLYPNRFVSESAQIIDPRQPVEFPASDAGYGFTVLPPAGRGRMVAMVVPEQLSLDREIAGAALSGRTMQAESRPDDYLLNLLRGFMHPPAEPVRSDVSPSRLAAEPAAWSVGVVHYTIEASGVMP